MPEADHDKFEIFQTFLDPVEAQNLCDELVGWDIPAVLEDNSKNFDATFANNAIAVTYFVRIHRKDFQRARELQEERFETESGPLDYTGHPFEDYSVEELREVLEKSFEWRPDDVVLARKILQSKGEVVTSEEIEQFRQNQLEQIRKPRKIAYYWFILYYLIIIFLGAIAPLWVGFVAISVGLYYWRDKTKDPEGERHFTYIKQTRSFGLGMLVIGTLLMILLLALYIIGSTSSYFGM